MTVEKNSGDAILSRREFLKSGVALISGSLLGKVGKAMASFSSLLPLAQKHIYIAPDDHTDYFWTEGESAYQQAFVRMIDYYLNLADATASNPSEHQSRWNCDGSFWLWTYEKNKTGSEYRRLINRIRDRHISVPLNALVVCLGGAPAEAVLRGMYYAGKIERREGIRFRMAISMENQTLPYGLTALWAGSGAQYSWKGICGCDSQVDDAWDREHEIYWYTAPDGSKVLMKWNSLLESNRGMGGYAEAYNPSAIVDYVDNNAAFKARYAYDVIGAFGRGWDRFETMTNEFVTVAQSMTNANRLVIVSNEEDFFRDFEAQYGASLPSVSASFGNEWDLYCAALAEVSARVKRSVEKLRGEEALATLVGLKDPGIMSGHVPARDTAWMDLGLFWEHNFGMVSPPSGLVNERVTWQHRLAGEIESYVNNLHADAVSALGRMIQKTGTNIRFFAFNPLNWTRSDMADFPYNSTSPVHVVDLSTGLETPSQIVFVDGVRTLRILAQNVPPVGYRVFEIQSGAGQSFTDAATVSAGGSVVDNHYYSVTIANRGAITSWLDKTRSNREFTKEIGGRVINDLGPGSGTLVVESIGPVSVTVLATCSTPLSHTSRITFIRDSYRIDIRNDINQVFNNTFTWGFGFELNNPDVWHEEVGAIIRAKLLSQGGHYSPRNARYDWLTLNHFADISDGSGTTNLGVTLSNADCYFMKLGNSTVGNLDVSTPQISALVGGRVANGSNGLPNQGGDTHFMQRFALRTHGAYNPLSAMKFALEHQNPFITGTVTGGDDYPGTSYSLLTIDNPGVLVWAIKPSEEGISQGVILRLWNVSSSVANFSLEMTQGPIVRARRTTHIETPIEDVALASGVLNGSLAPQQMKTFLVTLPVGRSRLQVPLVKG